MSAISKLAGQTAVYGLSSIIGKFLNYLLVPLYTYTLVPEKYGIISEFYAYVVVLQILLTYGLETGYFRFTQKIEDSKRVFSTVFLSLLATTVSFIVITFLFAKNISISLGYTENSQYVKIFILILGVDALTTIFFAKLRYLNKPFKFAFYKFLNIGINIFFNLFFILICPFLIKKGFNFISLFYSSQNIILYIFLSNLIASIFTLILFLPDFFKFKLIFDFKLWKEIINYSFPLLITGLAGAINEMADRILLKHWTVIPENVLDASSYELYQLGIYGANAKLAVIMMMFTQAFRYASEPFFFSHSKNNTNTKVFADVMKYYLIFAFLMFLGVILNIDIIKYFINKNYFEGLTVVLPLFMSRILVGIFFIVSFWFKLKDKTYYGIVIFAIGASITLIFNYFLIPKFGYIGCAWTNFFTYLIMVLIAYFWGRKFMKVPYEYFRIFLYLIFALILYFISIFLKLDNLIIKLLILNSLILLYIYVVLKIEKITFIQVKSLLKPKKNEN